MPSILISGKGLYLTHLRHHPGYVEDGDINWVEHYWYMAHFHAAAYRLSHVIGHESYYRFYFYRDIDAAEARLLTW